MHCNNLKLIIFILFVFSGHNVFCQTPQIEINSYDIKVGFEISNSRLNVKALLGLKKNDMVNEFGMLLTSNAKIDSIKFKINNDWIIATHSIAGNDSLCLTVPPELFASEDMIIDFEYSLPIEESEVGMFILSRGHRWYPLILDQIARFKLTAEVPYKYVVFSAGDLVEKKTYSETSQFIWESKIPVFKLPLIIVKSDFYNKTETDIDDKKIILYSSNIDAGTKKKIISETYDIFKFYNEHLGEYHHNRLTLIEIPELGGINLATGLIMLGPASIEGFKKGYYDGLHLSVATQWISAGVFFQLFGKGFWFLQLSFPHYLRLMYLEQAKGENAFNEGLQRGLNEYKKIAGTNKDIPIMDVDFPNTYEKSIIIYGKGPYVIDKLRRLIGDKDWENLIKKIYTDFKGKILTFDEFKELLSIYDKDGSCILILEKGLTGINIPED